LDARIPIILKWANNEVNFTSQQVKEFREREEEGF